MRKIIFIGRSEAGKTTLTQAMKGKKIVYHKTQYINHYDVIIFTDLIYLFKPLIRQVNMQRRRN